MKAKIHLVQIMTHLEGKQLEEVMQAVSKITPFIIGAKVIETPNPKDNNHQSDKTPLPLADLPTVEASDLNGS